LSFSENQADLENIGAFTNNMFILKNLKIEAKQMWLIFNCESSEAKRTQLLPKIKLAKRSKANLFIIKLYNIEA
jgi:hypothetical protein